MKGFSALSLNIPVKKSRSGTSIPSGFHRHPIPSQCATVSSVPCFFESRYKQITGLNVINNVQLVRNSQREDEFDDGTMQDEDVLSLVTMVNKADYTIRIGELSIRPMFKHLLLRRHSKAEEAEETDGSGDLESFSIYSPILRTKLTLTSKSDLQVAFQGFPFLEISS